MVQIKKYHKEKKDQPCAGERCYECKNWNHQDCRKGKKSREGIVQDCHCSVCQVPGVQIKQMTRRAGRIK